MKRALITGLTVVAALAAGCGDDGTDASDDGGTAPTTSASNPGSDSGEPAALPKFCDLLTADQLTEAVGASVTLETDPFGGCAFSQEDPRALSGTLVATELGEGAGGYETYQSGTKGAMDGPTRHEVPGLGDAAYVDIGTIAGGENLQVAGGVLSGTVIYTLNLAQATGMTEDELVAISETLLKLLVEAA
ncbi:MAG TPA: hypothetical protein VM575_18095 [Nocardioides sp.]|nr:hypothetical protein [Nocardioides sp.]